MGACIEDVCETTAVRSLGIDGVVCGTGCQLVILLWVSGHFREVRCSLELRCCAFCYDAADYSIPCFLFWFVVFTGTHTSLCVHRPCNICSQRPILSDFP